MEKRDGEDYKKEGFFDVPVMEHVSDRIVKESVGCVSRDNILWIYKNLAPQEHGRLATFVVAVWCQALKYHVHSSKKSLALSNVGGCRVVTGCHEMDTCFFCQEVGGTRSQKLDVLVQECVRGVLARDTVFFLREVRQERILERIVIEILDVVVSQMYGRIVVERSGRSSTSDS